MKGSALSASDYMIFNEFLSWLPGREVQLAARYLCPMPAPLWHGRASEMEILPFDPTWVSQINDISQPSGFLPAEMIIYGGSLSTGLGQNFWSVQDKWKKFSISL